MRTLISVKDILEEYNRPEICPQCGEGSPPCLVQGSVEIAPKGVVHVTKHLHCETHGHLSFTKQVKAVQMHGDDVTVIPPYK